MHDQQPPPSVVSTDESLSRLRIPVFALIATTGLSQFGNMLTAVAVPWFVLELTGSAVKTGITGAVIVLPTIIAGAFGGALVDRLGHKRTSVISDIASGLTVAIIPLLYLTLGITFWQLSVLMFLSALLDVPGGAARRSMIPELAERAGFQLERVNSAFSSVDRGAQLVGPLVAGFLIATIGATEALLIDAATFAISAAIVAIAIPLAVHTQDVDRLRGGYWSELVEGLQFIRQDHVLLSLIVIAAALNVIANPLTAVVLPVYAKEVFRSASNLGLMLASFGGGALVGALLYGLIGYRFSRRVIYVGSLLGSVVPYGILALTPGILLTVTALFAFGILLGPGTPIFMTVLQERTPLTMRGRIFGLMTASVWIVLPLGMLVSGFLLETLGVTSTLFIQATALLTVSMSALIVPTLRDLDAPSLERNSSASLNSLKEGAKNSCAKGWEK